MSGNESKNRVRKYFTTDPVQVIQNMFNGGKWLNTFQIPYYGNDYLISEFSSDWNIHGSEAFLGNTIAGSEKAKISTRGFGIEFPSNPKFTAKMGKGRKDITTEFYLVNTNKTWIVKNFQFIQAFFAGAEWLHMKYCQVRPPNVYHVLCPGRFQIYWAAIDVSVTFEGKLRKNVDASKEIMKYGIKSIDEGMLWPEAWKVNVSIKDLTPNNFNLYAEYYQHGFKAEEIKSLEEYIGLTDALSEIGNYVLQIAKEAGEFIKDSNIIEKAKNVGKTIGANFNILGLGTSLDERLASTEKLYEDAKLAKKRGRMKEDEFKKVEEQYEGLVRAKAAEDLKARGITSAEEIEEEVNKRMGRETQKEKFAREKFEKERQLALDQWKMQKYGYSGGYYGGHYGGYYGSMNYRDTSLDKGNDYFIERGIDPDTGKFIDPNTGKLINSHNGKSTNETSKYYEDFKRLRKK